MNTLWIAALIVFVAGRGPMTGMAKHEPFATQADCNAWVELTKPQTEEFVATMIDQGIPVIAYASVCVLPEDKPAPKEPA